MRKLLLLLLLLLGAGVVTSAQQGNTVIRRFTGAPTGGCSLVQEAVNNATGDFYDCLAGAWFKVGPTSGGGGTVTSIATTGPISGGTITTTGTISCPTCATGPGSSTNHGLASWNGTGGLALESLNTQFTLSSTTLTAGSAGVVNLSAAPPATGLQIPTGPGAIPIADGFIAVNSTNHALVWGSNSTTFVGAIAATGTASATTCSNQFVRSVSAIAVPVCNTIALASDVSGQLPIGNVGSAGLSGTAPIAISAAGAISCTTCTTTSSTFGFDKLTSATNTVAAMVMGTGASLTISGSGTINSTTLNGATFAAPGAIGGTTPGSVAATTISATGQITSTLATGTAPFSITSTTVVPNLNVSQLLGATWASPAAIGSSSAANGTFNSLIGTTITTPNNYLETWTVTTGGSTTLGLLVVPDNTANIATAATSAVGVIGIASSSKTSGQSVDITVLGLQNCIADNTVTAGHLLGVGTATAGRCKDLGVTTPLTVSNQLQIIGYALTGASVGNLLSAYVYGDGFFGTLPGGTTTTTIASGTSALATGAITSATCATVVTTAATGTASTDDIMADFNADPTAVTGYAPSASGMLTIIKYPTANNVNFKVCNNTAGSITPGAITLNWRVVR